MSFPPTPRGLRASSKDWNQSRRRLAKLTVLIDTLTAEQARIQVELDSIVYPVLSLPNEITSNIFLQSIPSDAQPSRHTSPLLLTQICRQWRAVAFATPGIWQSITLNRRVHWHDEVGKLLEMWLKYSATLPLFLSLGCYDPVQMQPLVDASLARSHRWQEITLSSPVNIDAANRHFPLLRKVSLSRDVGGTVIIHNAPVLRQASVGTTPCFDVHLPWDQLTTLMVNSFSSPECLQLLSSCARSLLHLTHRAVIDRSEFADAYSQPHIILDSLRSLEISFRGRDLVSHLTLPRLRQLQISGKGCTPTERVRVEALLARSSCQLRCLRIIFDEKPDPAQLQYFLRGVPTVTDLQLMFPALDHFIEIISREDILPAMETLFIDAVRVHDDYESLLRMLHSRTRTLKSFELSLRPHLHPDSPSASRPLPEITMVQFRGLVKDGLKCRLGMQGQPQGQLLFDTFGA
ncbi:hypothetical protein C8R43DRAFT_969644 [Mycena crocata]|nr:hypothetical protein C8R43DRAFT_969644 [Mycena crocata]